MTASAARLSRKSRRVTRLPCPYDDDKPADASRDVPVHAEKPIAVVRKNLSKDVRVTLGTHAGVDLVDVRTLAGPARRRSPGHEDGRQP